MRAKKQAMTFYPITVASAVHMDGTDKNLKDDYSEFKSEIEQVRTATTGEKFDTMNERIDLEIGRLKKGFTDVNLIEQDSKEVHSIQNTCEGHIHDLIIKGRTLKNLVDKNTYNKETEYEFNSRFGRVEIRQNTNCSFNDTCYFKVSITKLSECTLSVEHDTKPFIISFLGVGGYAKTHLTVKQWKVLKISETIVVYGERQLNVNEENRLQVSIGIGINFEVPDSGSTGRFKVNNCVVTKDTTPQDFFEDIESFGQKEGKISILSHGKNLININNFEILGDTTVMEIKTSEEDIKVKMKLAQNWTTAGVFKLKVKPNTNYIFGRKMNINVYGHGESTWGCGLITIKEYANNNGISLKEISNPSVEFTTGSGENIKSTKFNTGECNYIGIFIRSTTSPVLDNQFTDFIVSNLFLYEVSNDEDYDPYKCDKKDILLPQYGFNEGLRGIGIVADELNYIRKVAIKRIEKDTFNGKDEEGWLYVPAQSQGNSAYFQSNFLDSKVKFPKPQLIADTLNTGTILWDIDDIEGINVEGNINGDSCLRIRILKSKLSTIDVDGLKAWLKTNPVTLYYELAEPIETPLKEIIELSSYNDTTYVSFENNIRGTSSFKLPVDISKTLLTLVDGKESLENTVDDLSNEINQIKTYMIQMLSK